MGQLFPGDQGPTAASLTDAAQARACIFLVCSCPSHGGAQGREGKCSSKNHSFTRTTIPVLVRRSGPFPLCSLQVPSELPYSVPLGALPAVCPRGRVGEASASASGHAFSALSLSSVLNSYSCLISPLALSQKIGVEISGHFAAVRFHITLNFSLILSHVCSYHNFYPAVRRTN